LEELCAFVFIILFVVEVMMSWSEIEALGGCLDLDGIFR
jgi:hypothetical protein